MSPRKPITAVTLASGGIDSGTLAYLLASQGHHQLLLSIDYGQRHRDRELEAAATLAGELNAPHKILDAPWLGEFMVGSSLADPTVDVPHGMYDQTSMNLTVGKGRNAALLGLAYVAAGGLGARFVAFAAHAGDHPIYRDCRPEFLRAYAAAQVAGMDPPVPELYHPFALDADHMTKAEIIGIGHALKVPWGRRWSCYVGGQVHCGRCGTCTERIEAFILADVADPTLYDPDGYAYARSLLAARHPTDARFRLQEARP